MFNNNAQRNFEWFEASFTRKIQHIINENNRDNASWIRDLFISILLAILPLACELIMNHQPENNQTETSAVSEIIHAICMYGTIISLVGLVIWIGFCVWKYNKAVQKFKSRVIPHTIKGKYSLDESVHYFDNDVCNDLILAKHYISLSLHESDAAGKEFYYIESLHHYYKSIRRFILRIINSRSGQSIKMVLMLPIRTKTSVLLRLPNNCVSIPFGCPTQVE